MSAAAMSPKKSIKEVSQGISRKAESVMKFGGWGMVGNAINSFSGRGRQMALNAKTSSDDESQSLEQLQLMAQMLENEANMVAGDNIE